MSKIPVINITNIKLEHIINNNNDNNDNYNTFDKLRYKFDNNIEEDFNIFINWSKIKIIKSFDGKELKFKFLDENIIKIIDKITGYLNLEISSHCTKFSLGHSQIDLIPSKKSNIEVYRILKSECFSQIDKYFPFHYKKNTNTNINIVGKFIIQCFIFKNSTSHKSYISFRIINAEIKYEHSFVKDEQIKLESVYNKHIIMTI